ncbi:hypothetical protein PROFUN_12357 [Planoprotostelium fungivorum]|uniref:Uncharacterized protein n=1 Tax=Planoprotostelium fungivorum TaxID=1890364 RepID=A0A2P6N9G5_9EUKA|nr:hypothetical protein PROFUN_12357 [Planoprotostelium fungivorum]
MGMAISSEVYKRCVPFAKERSNKVWKFDGKVTDSIPSYKWNSLREHSKFNNSFRTSPLSKRKPTVLYVKRLIRIMSCFIQLTTIQPRLECYTPARLSYIPLTLLSPRARVSSLLNKNQ